MGRLREYRRDEDRIVKTILERNPNISNAEEFDRAYRDYMGTAQQDPLFKDNVLRGVKSKLGKDFSKVPPKAFKKVERPTTEKFVFAGRTRTSKKIQSARFDPKVNKYRNAKGQFVKLVK